MTGRTHDLAAITALTAYIAYQPLLTMSLATGVVAMAANLLGGVAPDLDQPTAGLWNKIPAGSIFGRILHPLLGSHRLISHSIVGIFMVGWLMNLLLGYTHNFLLVDENIVWYAFMFGYISHLVMDTFTREGVPWLFPIPIRFGIPPFKFLRLTTGGILEKSLVYPGLMIFNGYLFYHNYRKFIDFVTHHVVK
jgi:inner membrane protein